MDSNVSSLVEVPLTKGLVARIDSTDADVVAQYVWHTSTTKSGRYAATNVPTGTGGYRRLYMHRLLLESEVSKDRPFVDHINGDGLDNRRANIRACTTAQNNLNRTRSADRVTGVYAQGNHWIVKFRRGGVAHYIGCFKTYEAAAETARSAHARIHADDSAFLTRAEA